jgi:FtsH-binding integral membrane protein
MAPYLFGGLIALILARVAQVALAAVGVPEVMGFMGVVEYAGALLFTPYIVYDWNRALRLPRTMDNAVDASMAIFLDIINLVPLRPVAHGRRGLMPVRNTHHEPHHRRDSTASGS